MDIQAKVCALFADFSRLPSEKALPYIAWLDLAESRLTPGALQRQKFVYHIAPVDRRETLDSARFALHLCRQIPFADCQNFRASADGRDLPPDAIHPLAEGGFVVDWPLSAVQAVLSVQFELAEARPIGRAEAFFPGRSARLALSGPVCGDDAAGQYVWEIALPFAASADVRLGEPAIWCLGAPRVEREADGCFTIRQRLFLDLPANHAAHLQRGKPQINQSIT